MLFIARRYLFSKKSHSVVNIIAGVSLVSVAIPVAAIIILLSIFNGFGTLVDGMNSSIEADLTINPSKGRYFVVGEVDTLALRGVEGVEAFALIREQSLMLEYQGRESTVNLRGVDDAYVDVVPIGERMRSGEFRVRLGDFDRLVLGNSMAQQLGVRRGVNRSAVNIYSLRESRLSSIMPIVSFVRDSADLAGVFLLDMDSEERIAYSSLRLMQRLSGNENEVSQIVVRVADGHSMDVVKSRVLGVVGDKFKVLRREELNPVLYDIIKYEKWGIIFISMMVMLLASFSLIGIVAMLIIEKRDDVNSLRAMGATWNNVRSIFFMQGMLISGAGALVGV